MQLYFIRHGQSENNELWARTGSADGRSPDPDLTETGRKQSLALAEYLAGGNSNSEASDEDARGRGGLGLTHLYTSLMLRALSTANILAEVLELPLVAWEIIHEWGGIYRVDESGERIGLPGPDRAYFATHFPRLVLSESFGDGGWWNRPFEPPENAIERARRFLPELYQRHGRTDDRVAIVSHGGFYDALLKALLGLELPSDTLGEPREVWFAMNNAAVTRIDFSDDAVIVVYQNRLRHLRPELIT